MEYILIVKVGLLEGLHSMRGAATGAITAAFDRALGGTDALPHDDAPSGSWEFETAEYDTVDGEQTLFVTFKFTRDLGDDIEVVKANYPKLLDDKPFLTLQEALIAQFRYEIEGAPAKRLEEALMSIFSVTFDPARQPDPEAFEVEAMAFLDETMPGQEIPLADLMAHARVLALRGDVREKGWATEVEAEYVRTLEKVIREGIAVLPKLTGYDLYSKLHDLTKQTKRAYRCDET